MNYSLTKEIQTEKQEDIHLCTSLSNDTCTSYDEHITHINTVMDPTFCANQPMNNNGFTLANTDNIFSNNSYQSIFSAPSPFSSYSYQNYQSYQPYMNILPPANRFNSMNILANSIKEEYETKLPFFNTYSNNISYIIPKTNIGGKPRRHSLDESLMQTSETRNQYDIKKARNRISALRCRERKKKTVQNNIIKLTQTQNENNELCKIIQDLQDEAFQLHQLLDFAKPDCTCSKPFVPLPQENTPLLPQATASDKNNKS